MRGSWVEEAACTESREEGWRCGVKKIGDYCSYRSQGREWLNREGEDKNYVEWKVKNTAQNNFDYEVGTPCFLVLRTY